MRELWLGRGGRDGDLLPDDPDLAPLDERVEFRFDFASGYFGVAKDRAAITGRLRRNLNPLLRYRDGSLVVDKGWFKMWLGGRFPTRNTFNATVEKLATTWSGSFKDSRALVPADWFNEKGGDFTVESGQPFLMAAVFNRVDDPETGGRDDNVPAGDPPVCRCGGGAERADAAYPATGDVAELAGPQELGTRQLAVAAVAASAEISDGIRYLPPSGALF